MAKPIRHGDKWRIRPKDENGNRISKVFDTKEEANFWLARQQTEVGEIKRGYRIPTPKDRAFNELCDYWLKNHSSQKRSERSDRSIIKVHLRPAFGRLQLKNIGVEFAEKLGVIDQSIEKDRDRGFTFVDAKGKRWG
ncbi:MAG: hypothetical protein AABZ06_11460 [Bdellovibrionota bacterium]